MNALIWKRKRGTNYLFSWPKLSFWLGASAWIQTDPLSPLFLLQLPRYIKGDIYVGCKLGILCSNCFLVTISLVS